MSLTALLNLFRLTYHLLASESNFIHLLVPSDNASTHGSQSETFSGL